MKDGRSGSGAESRTGHAAHRADDPAEHGGVPVARVLVVMSTWIVACWAALGLLFAPVVPGGWGLVAVLGVFSALPLVVLVRGFATRAYPGAAVRLWVLRPFWYVQLGLPLLVAGAVVGTGVGLLVGHPGVGGRVAVAAMFALLVLAGVWGYVGSRRLRVEHLSLRFAALPVGLEGLRIVQLSDLHVGPHTPRRYLRRIVSAARAARPDLVAITGDQVDDYAEDVTHFVRAFRELSAPLGVFAVAGNHDVYAGWSAVRDGMEAAGIRVLVNEAVPLDRAGARLWLAGTGDPAGSAWSRDGGADAAPDVERTLADVPPGAFTVVLAHNPALWPSLAGRGVHLTLSGHTHHGQLSIPRWRWSLASPFLDLAMGLHRRGDSVLYISPGTNYWGLPLRIGALPEVTVVVLTR